MCQEVYKNKINLKSLNLNYEKYFVEGETHITEVDDYTSHNTQRLSVEEVKTLLLKLDYIQETLNA